MSFEQEGMDKINRDLKATEALLKSYSNQMESYMKGNAPWTDQSAQARQSLHSDVLKRGKHTFILYAAHGKDYGLILEDGSRVHSIPNAFGRGITVIHPGTKPYPIVGPTMEHFQGKVTASVLKLWGH